MRHVLQNEAGECGLACLATVASHHGLQVDMQELRRRFSVSLKGLTLNQLMRNAGQLRLLTRPVRLELEQMDKLTMPCILHWNLNHFVVLKAARRTQGAWRYAIFDPAVGERLIGAPEMSASFTGVALELSPNEAFSTGDTRQPLSAASLLGKVAGLRGAVLQAIGLALCLEVFAICIPLFNQLVLDQAIVSRNKDFLRMLALGFALILITQNLISLARGWFLMRWSMSLSLQWTSKIFAHLVNLPAAYFERRHLGDIVTRFGSIGSIQSILTSLFIETTLDGLMAMMALALMLFYSVKLCLLVLLAVCLYALLRVVLYPALRRAAVERLTISSKETTYFLETLRSITALKMFGKEDDRIARWQSLKVNVQNQDLKNEKLSIFFRVGNTAIFGMQGLALFYLGGAEIMDGRLSIGMLVAFASYSGTFTTRISNLIDIGISVKMLGMHLERLSDIVLETPTPLGRGDSDTARFDGTLTLAGIRFRYAEGEPWILDGCNLTIHAGDSIAITGASGCGKTTLGKIMLGLLQPTEGQVLLDGVPIEAIGYGTYRHVIGAVLQEDILMSGSIADNIAFFDSERSQAKIEEVASAAAIHGDIMRMPMAYHTLVGDMGSALSGGQKQRILLARALYKNPRILLLDEASSHLDLDAEARINAMLNQSRMTRIVIAHRPETIASARIRVEIRDGKIIAAGVPAIAHHLIEEIPC